MFTTLLTRLWNDETGSIVATEYLMLGTIVSLGGAAGLATVRDSMNDEYKEFGASVREVRQSYSYPSRKGSSGSSGGVTVNDPSGASAAPAGQTQAAPTLNGQQIQFSVPAP
jgi:Flp pilus assembly pilin Flp